ncbi:MAG: hypothetical protein SCARUB_04526 [Candidatus Scalindua rubra]|uniref:Ribbon-helix-helix protein CopG domain-containing protein n=1 Tax=Candidatus Scalindua rubra TaxID=1872076 RepID=A0A1E3X433_9BACT|nr:MAG: hypothetical protein SCARUB_04526 [Candidatus Scalindua rubra]
MRLEHSSKEELKRVSLTLPNSLHDEFEEIRQRVHLNKVEAIREAVNLWIQKQLAEEMIEGYKSMWNEDLEMLKEFEHVDREIW